MSPRDLLKHPCWSAKDLGAALPDSPHAVSVALPRWNDVVAYEEKDPICTKALKAIYPRFGLNPLVSEVANQAIRLSGFANSTAWPYPDLKTAKKAQLHCQKVCQNAQTSITEFHGLHCLIASNETTADAKAFWQHTGLGASSRQAAIALNKEQAPLQKSGIEARDKIIKRLAKIYECEEGLFSLHPSGMAALYSALEVITELQPGKPTIQIGFPYVDVLKLPQVIFSGGELILETDLLKLSKKLDQIKPAAIIIELPSNPLLQCIDLQGVSKIAHQKRIPVIVDDTIGSAVNINVLPYSDIVFTSLTKSFAGRGDILAGSLVISPHSPWREVLLKKVQAASFSSLSDSDSIALELTSQDVINRLILLNQSCLTLKKRLEQHPEVSRVLHPEKCPNFHSLMRPGAGHGCLLSFELKEGISKAKRFYDALEVCKGPSLGTNFTLACPYVLLAHYNELEWAEECGLPRHLLRVSVGLEEPENLWQRFEKAFRA
ncbi:PLP-dependent transferase [Prochlorococcus sp. MIT 1300]|uniref:PLP-dependent transferase n=1 Tax=Prochlorococcus sp. MIT 1300 TaxID=3096218 RepID=UPI002A75A1A4|nr:PLP-dependent transferase [Prochlorococcus sp. MIT 1300]